MIKINGQEKRNLQEQVLKNKEDIEDLKSGRTNPSFSDITGQPSDNTNLNNALNSKVDKVTGKGLSSNDFTNADKSKLDGINMASKQDALTTAQLNAVNSGVTSADVTAIASLITQMATKSPLLEAGANITLTPLGSGKIQISSTGGSGGGTWGTITGSLSNQTDLWNELQSKLNASAITAYRTASDQTAIDTALQNLVNTETARATYEEGQLQTAINGCLTTAKISEGRGIDITINPDGTMVIASSFEAMEFKGTVPTYADLPSGARNGDTYVVQANWLVYTFTTSGWVQTGAAFDISNFYTRTQADAKFLPFAGGTMTGDLIMDNNDIDMASGKITNLPTPVESHEAANKQYVDDEVSREDTYVVHKTGDETISGVKTFLNGVTAKDSTVGVAYSTYLYDGIYVCSDGMMGHVLKFPALTTPEATILTTESGSATYVTLDTDQTITGKKNFQEDISLDITATSGEYRPTKRIYFDEWFIEAERQYSGVLEDYFTNFYIGQKRQSGSIWVTNRYKIPPFVYGNDGKTFALAEDIQASYLPKSGGTMTGSLRVNAGTDSIVSSVDNSVNTICGGTSQDKGASLQLRGKDLASNPGWAVLTASDGTNSPQLVAKPDGTFKWNNENVLTQRTTLPVLTVEDSSKWQLWSAVYSLGSNTYFMSITVKNISGSAQGSLDCPVVKINGIANDCALATACYEAPTVVIGAVIQTRSGGTDKVIKLRTNGALIPNGAYIPISGVFRWTAS